MLGTLQAEVLRDSTATVNLLTGAVSAGKTFIGNMAFPMMVQEAPARGLKVIIGKTKDTAERNVIEPMMEMLPGEVRHTRGSSICRIFGKDVWVLGANDAKAEGKLRGATVAVAYADELSLYPPGYVEMLLTRLRTPKSRLLATTNPDHPRHTVKVELMDRAVELGYRHWHFGMDDNPSLTDEYKARMRAQFHGLFYDRFIDGKWVAAEGAIYAMLDENKHCRPAPDKSLWEAAWVGIDYGTSNPTHAVLIVLASDRLWCVAEWQHNGRKSGQLDDATQSTRLAAWLGGELPDSLGAAVVLDPSAASLRVQMRAHSWPTLRTADNRVSEGIKITSSLLGGGKLMVDKDRCPILWDELCGYVWDDKALDRGEEEEPAKVDDHGPDALRYGIMAARPVWRHWLPALAAA